MSRYIDADELNKMIEAEFAGVTVYDVSPNEAVSDFQHIVDSCPTADVAPVVHGHWENIENAKNTIKCSNCGHIRELRHFSEIIKRPKLCEMCGAKMDKIEDKNDESV